MGINELLEPAFLPDLTAWWNLDHVAAPDPSTPSRLSLRVAELAGGPMTVGHDGSVSGRTSRPAAGRAGCPPVAGQAFTAAVALLATKAEFKSGTQMECGCRCAGVC